MRTNLLAAAFAALLSVPAFAQVEVKISFPWLAPPPLVVVEPGIQVVPDYPEEVFFVDSWYWVRRDGRWFRARDYRAGWSYVTAPPAALVRIPPGRYRHWKQRAVIREVAPGGGKRIAAPPPGQSHYIAAPPAGGGRQVSAPPAASGGTRVAAPPGKGGKGKGKKD
ncbi:MAG TPA: hypothetical protein VFB81_09685 [Myxococcales bacterium]|nr:hypothetical protein [Myxococcales bacterium]